MDESAKDLILKLLEKNPLNRMKITDLKKHPYFNDINFNDIYNMKVKPPFEPSKVKIVILP